MSWISTYKKRHYQSNLKIENAKLKDNVIAILFANGDIPLYEYKIYLLNETGEYNPKTYKQIKDCQNEMDK